MNKSSKRILIWTDGGKNIGMGHVMRSLSIAQSLQEFGLDVTFKVNQEEAVVETIIMAGFSVVTGEDEFQKLQMLRHFDGVIFDTKNEISEEVRYFKANGLKVIFIDKVTAAPGEPDCVIIPSLINSTIKNLSTKQKNILAGLEYFPLNHHFIRARRIEKPPRETGLRVLVSMGGSDPNDLTMQTVRALKGMEGITLTVVAGPSMRDASAVGQLIGKERLIHKADVKKMALLMNQTDIAFTAFGITLYELAFMGVPSLIIANYRNDKENMDAFGNRGAGIPLGYYEDVKDNEISDSVALFLQNNDLLEKMAREGRALIDGNGAKRIARVICNVCGVSSSAGMTAMSQRNI